MKYIKKTYRKQISGKSNNCWFEVLRDYFNNKCNYCGKVKNLHLHHIIPRSKGGKNRLSNIELVCRECHWKIHKQLSQLFPRKDMKEFGKVDRLVNVINKERRSKIVSNTVERKKESNVSKNKVCPQCKKEFAGRKNRIFCSKYCRFKMWDKTHPRQKISLL